MGQLLILSDHVNQCYSNADGEIILEFLKRHFANGEKVNVSFKGMDSASSSFINSAFIELLECYDFTFIRDHLSFSNTTKTINDTIKRRFAYEVSGKRELINV